MEEKVYMKGYKAFKPGMVCDLAGNRFQYAENTVFEMEESPVVCESGFHFCKYPLDVLDYYPLINDDGTVSEFAQVEALDDCVTDDDKKYSTRKIRIGAKFGLKELVQAAVTFDYTSIKSKGGDEKDWAQIASSLDCVKMASSGYWVHMASSGDRAQMASSGYFVKMTSSGESVKMASSGENAVVMCSGDDSKAKAKKGSWITLGEWDYVNGKYTPVCVKTERVDWERIKEDTWYKLSGGEFVEVE